MRHRYVADNHSRQQSLGRIDEGQAVIDLSDYVELRGEQVAQELPQPDQQAMPAGT